jgi:hypothetical protein
LSPNDDTELMLPLATAVVLFLCTGVVSSSVKGWPDDDEFPRAEALRGPILPLRVCAGGLLLGSPAVPRTLWANLFDVGLPNLVCAFGPGVAIEGRGAGVICSRLTGESGRGSEGRDRLPVGLGARPGPTDWLNLGSVGVGGV